MTATSYDRTTEFAGTIPSKGTYPVAANTRLLRGTIAVLNADGRADNVAAGLNACGKYASQYNNLSTSSSGGAAGAIDAEVQFGVFGWGYTGTAPKPGQVVYAVDNQTVSIDSDTGSRGIAGYCTELTDGICYVWMGPHVVAQIVIASAEASQLDQAQADIDALQANALTASGTINIPLTSLTTSDATPLGKFASEAAATFGLNIADSEALCVRWNNHATPGTALACVGLPPDLDDTEDVLIEALVSKSGATVGDATTLGIAAYIIASGNLHDSDANCGGTTDAVVGDATAKTTDTLTLTISAANVPANARLLNLAITPTAGTLGTDDLLLHELRVRYTRKLLAA